MFDLPAWKHINLQIYHGCRNKQRWNPNERQVFATPVELSRDHERRLSLRLYVSTK